MWEKRNWADPNYKAWRLNVYRRDRFKCMFPKCGATKKLNAHHIKRWASFPLLRFEVSNGITLCKAHHDLVTGKEEEYEQLFNSILGNDHTLRIRRELRRRLLEDPEI